MGAITSILNIVICSSFFFSQFSEFQFPHIISKRRISLAGLVIIGLYQGFWIYLYFRLRHSFAHLRPVILSADWSIRQLQSWTCSSLPTVAEFVKLTQNIVIEIQRQSADLYKVQLCNRQFFEGVPAIYVVKVYECHPLGYINSNL